MNTNCNKWRVNKLFETTQTCLDFTNISFKKRHQLQVKQFVSAFALCCEEFNKLTHKCALISSFFKLEQLIQSPCCHYSKNDA